VKDSKNIGVKESLVSVSKFFDIINFNFICHLTFTLLIASLCYQGKGSVEKETEVKLLGVKDLKDNGVEARVPTSLI
jgi:hypothetical protein